MFSYQNITNRNEFIQKFREDQGLSKNSRVNTVGSESAIASPIKKGRNVNASGNVSNSHSLIYLQGAHSRLNTSSGKIKQQNEGRWDYLHKLEKLKRMKLDEQRRRKEEELFEQDLQQCTFSPKLNTNKSTGNLRGRSQKSGGIAGLSSIGNTNLHTPDNYYSYASNSPKYIDSPHKKNESSPTIAERQKQWIYKRDVKLDKIKQNKIINENKECIFTPKLNSPDKLKKIEIDAKAKNLVVDPESYEAYVKRQSNHRSYIERQQKREKSLPGSGNIWTNKVTKPQDFHLATESSHASVNKSYNNIKSISKPVAPNKFQNLKSNYKVGDGRAERKNKLNTSDLIYSQRDKYNINELEQKCQNAFKFNNDKIEFNSAIQSLHDQLHSINLLGYD